MNWQHVLEQLVATAATVLGILTPLVPILLPIFTGFIKDKRHAQAFAHVTRAGLLAANEASRAMRVEFEKAIDPKSQAGRAVTEEELNRIINVGSGVGLKHLKDHGLLQQVLEVYGGEDAVRLALEQLVRSKAKEILEALTKSIAKAKFPTVQ